MAWFSKLNPTPAFPAYTGPYTVGSVDVEIPVSDLNSPSPAPDSSIPTVSFRVFYPCEPKPSTRPVRWIPNPQRGYISAYARFLGASPTLANVFALIPQLLYYVSIPVQRNAPLLSPKHSDRWPVLVFSHGLGGSRNAYSHFCGSMASHGVVVFAPEHRDGSCPITYVRQPGTSKSNTVNYRTYSHTPTQEVFDGRDEQLKIRLWEMGLIHDAILKIDRGEKIQNLDSNSLHYRKKDVNDVLSMFHDQLDVHRPGAIAWGGHSFGGATTYQLVKSVYYRRDSEKPGYTPLFTPASDSAIVKQITPSTPVILLDMWCLPLQSPNTRWLWQKPLPCYDSNGPGGKAVLAILSEAFFKWREHLAQTKRALSESPDSPSATSTKPPPRFFYPLNSAHLSQSDFGVLFPWMTKKAFNADEPERTLLLNTRAALQLLRDNGLKVADTSAIDREEEEIEAETGKDAAYDSRGQDSKILDPKGNVRGWVYLTTTESSDDAPTTDTNSPSESAQKSEFLVEINKQSSYHKFHRSGSSDAYGTSDKIGDPEGGIGSWDTKLTRGKNQKAVEVH